MHVPNLSMSYMLPLSAELGWGEAAPAKRSGPAGKGAGGQGRAAVWAGWGAGCPSGSPEGCPLPDEPVCHGPPGTLLTWAAQYTTRLLVK